MNEDIPIRFRWTYDELLSGYRAHFRHRFRPVFRWAFWLLTAVFIFNGIFQVWNSDTLFPGGFVLLIGIYIPIVVFVIRPWRLRRQFAKRPDRDAEIEWRISADSIHTCHAHGTSNFTWPALAKVVQTPEGFLLYPTEEIFHWLPRHGFASDTDFDRLSQLAQLRATAFHRNA